MKEKYEQMELEIVVFEGKDIITVSDETPTGDIGGGT